MMKPKHGAIRKNLAIVMLAVAVLLGAGTASYAVTIDFRDNAWSAAEAELDGQFTLGDVTLTAMPQGARLWHDTTDGIGVIYNYENDEIEQNERLLVTFSSQVLLDYVFISDFFYECRSGACYNEIGEYSLNGSDWTGFIAPNSNLPSPATNGEMTLNIGGVLTNSLWLRAPGIIGTQDHEYALQKIAYSSVPEPSTLLLLGGALIGLGFVRRKFKG
ncbi:MAG: hypothetical protein BMS9Abin23_0091 [Thermodesulfobacteriota bacterium]|nr:MAG: hypothetical protein BMS9Abin23_0091 [Thermodesulfobacteriota bacterium]